MNKLVCKYKERGLIETDKRYVGEGGVEIKLCSASVNKLVPQGTFTFYSVENLGQSPCLCLLLTTSLLYSQESESMSSSTLHFLAALLI